jgi:phosphatidylserine decarboxylase
MIPIVREGWPFIFISAGIAAAAFALKWHWAGGIFLVLTALLLNFFRDPERTVPQDPCLILSPADGHVVKVVDAPADGPLGPRATQISIFLSVFDVHVNRAPIAGKIVDVKYNPGAFLPAFDDKASLRNEQNRVTIDDGRGFRVVFTQIAGLIARRIVFRKQVGDTVGPGERVGMIRFGSRTDVFVPAEVKITVKKGDYVKGGLTVLGTRP